MAALVLYASCYPFVGWRWPPGLATSDMPWLLPWPQHGRLRFDELSNFLGYLPLGGLLVVALRRSDRSRQQAVVAAVLASAALSYTAELLQQFLPTRVPSLRDVLFNVSGATAGALLAAAIDAAGALDRWHGLRERWFERDSAPALVLLLLWPVALLFPTPAPLGLGHFWGELEAALEALLAGTPWAGEVARWLPSEAAGPKALPLLKEVLITALGLLAPCLVAYATTHDGWHRLLLVAGALAIGVGMMAMSTGLTFGVEHAWAWWLPHTGPALAVGALLAAALAGVGSRSAAAIGVLTLGLQVALVAQAPDDPYFAASLAGWEQGRLVRFHGMAQWVGWLWPYVAMVWLLVRLVRPART